MAEDFNNNLPDEGNKPENSEGKKEGKEDTPTFWHEVIEWTQAIAAALIIAVLVRGYVFEMIRVEGPSMNTTLAQGQRLVIYKLGYTPKQQDIIVFQQEPGSYKLISWWNDKSYIKRVIATPGQTVDIKDGKVYVDGKVLDEPYLNQPTEKMRSDMTFPLTVPENKVFVLGDNRRDSTDSRMSSVGLVDYKKVKGKAVFRVMPLDKFGALR